MQGLPGMAVSCDPDAVAAHAVEFLLLFFIGPTVLDYARHRLPAIPALWALMAYCLFILLHDPAFDRESLWNLAPLREFAPAILELFALTAVIGIVLVRRFGAPGLFLNLPRSNPRLWSLVMIFYPILSVYPQGIIYRALGFPTDMFTVLFALGRLPGWIAQWKEMKDNKEPIGRPRQIYVGATSRDYVDIKNR